MSDPGVMTPYSTVAPLADLTQFGWVPEEEQERLSAYDAYEKIYWSYPQAFKLTFYGSNDKPLYIPNGRTIVNETTHYLLKGLNIAPEGGDLESPFGQALTAFLKRERFLSKFHTAKWSGIVRGDWLLHMTADPALPEGRRISIVSVDPSSYFPIWDPDDLDKRIGVDLVETFESIEDGKTYVKRLRYIYVMVGQIRRVQRQEEILELEGWWNGKAAKVKRRLLPPELLPEDILAIPVYHFKNIDWQGDPFGGSELKGYESLLGSINQAMSDEELALALDGLGVYATDAPPPTDDNENEIDWELFPGKVLEVPTGSTFSRVAGIQSVTPMLDHVKHLTEALFESSATFRTNAVDVQLAESGVALAIKFSPTLAKLELRDNNGIDLLENLFFDWKGWLKTYEGQDFEAQEVAVTLGEKLPQNREKLIMELNNMLDRQVITREFYRQQLEQLGYYKFPTDIGPKVLEEQKELAEARTPPQLQEGPNNQDRPNESAGTEAQQSLEQQQRPN